MRRNRDFIGPAGMGGMVSLWGASSLIASVQRGLVSIAAGATSGTATITAVSTNDTFLSYMFWEDNGTTNTSGDPSTVQCALALTNGTTLTATRFSAADAFEKYVGYEVIQFRPGVIKSVQRGTCGIESSVTITSVETNKCTAGMTGWITSFPAWQGNIMPRAILTSGTNLSVSSGFASGTGGTATYQVLEFF